ncbi:hypothetical protein [Aeromonas sp. R7-5]|uniref:hypothetical protein n=1 Tax=Aeromonas sp. R7-5 TaxID=3138477 RepID=UPI0034A45E7E
MTINLVRLVLVFLLLCTGLSVHAATLRLTAEYKPSISNPSHTRFTNTTPLSGYCSTYPDYCPAGGFSILIPSLNAEKRFVSSSDDIKKHTYAHLDSRPREIHLFDRRTGERIAATFRLNLVAMRVNGEMHGGGWNGAGLNPQGGCTRGVGVGNSSWYMFGWGYPSDVQTCHRKIKTGVSVDQVYRIADISVGYELEIDSPMGVHNGIYEGELTYSIGDNDHIDLGAETYSDSELTIQIQATVEHAFSLQFPEGSERLVLSPEGGWAKWLNSGQQPTRLRRDLDFFLTTSGPITVVLDCEHRAGMNCGLRNTQGGEVVPLETRLTLPGLQMMGAEVKEALLHPGGRLAFFDVSDFVFTRRSTLHFWVEQPAVETMLRQPGSTWRGRVTLIFDGDI